MMLTAAMGKERAAMRRAGNTHGGGRSTGVEAVSQQGPGGQGQQDGPRTAADRASCTPEAHRLGEAGGGLLLRSYS